MRQLVDCESILTVQSGNKSKKIRAKICYVGTDFVEVQVRKSNARENGKKQTPSHRQGQRPKQQKRLAQPRRLSQSHVRCKKVKPRLKEDSLIIPFDTIQSIEYEMRKGAFRIIPFESFEAIELDEAATASD